MEMNQNIPFHHDDNEHGMDQMEREDEFSEMGSQQRIPTSGDGSGTPTHDSSSESTAAKCAKVYGSVSTWTYDPNVARESLGRLIAATDLPLNFGESSFYEDHIRRSYCPQFQRVSRTTIRSDLIAYYNKMRIALKSEIGSSKFCIALTSEIWSGREKEDYLNIVAHYLDSKWMLQKRIIDFKLIDHKHSIEDICEHILSIVDEYSIRNRIISITLDNAFANTKVIGQLEGLVSSYTGGFLLHQYCACHVINLVVKSGMKMIDEYINKVRSAISWINSSNPHIAEFIRYCKTEGLKPRKFGLDMPTKWNSTYLMLKSTLEYKSAITVFYNSKIGSAILNEYDWLIIEKFVQFLKVFYDYIVVLSGVYYPTSPLVLRHIFEIVNMFLSNKNDELFKPIVEVMEMEFKKYWYEIPLLYSFAFIFDPRIKLQGLSNVLSHIGTSLDLDFTNEFTNVRDKLFEVYAMYEKKFCNLRNQQTQQAQHRPKRSIWEIIYGPSSTSSSMSQQSTPTSTSQYSELNKYIEVNFSILDFEDDEDFSILQWWQMRQSRFPILSQLARDILTIPVSTISSEIAFSTTGRILEERRISLTSDMVEVLTCLKDWEYAAKRMQHTTHNEELVNQFQNLYVNDDALTLESEI